MPLAGPWLEHVFALHLQQVLRSDALTQEQRRAGKLDDTQQAVTAFADLVGFTELGESVPVEELGSVAGRLSRLAGEACEPPVRLVKLIGDAVMLVSPEPAPMLDATLRLVEMAAEDEASRRCAPGSPAARRCTAGATGSARRSTSPAAHHGRAAVYRAGRRGGPRRGRRRGYEFSYAGRKKLKGFSAPVRAYRARRSSDAAPAAPAPTPTRASGARCARADEPVGLGQRAEVRLAALDAAAWPPAATSAWTA